MSLSSLIAAKRLPDRVSISKVESNRFGVTVGRLDLGPDARCDPEEILQLVDRDAPEVVVLRFPARWVSWFATLTSGPRVAIHADSLVYWGCNLAAPPAGFAIEYRLAQPNDQEMVERLARATFGEYESHYLANPLLSPEDVGAGYGEWAGSFTNGDDHATVLTADRGETAAFASMLLESERGEICLAGVGPEARGRGKYHQLLESTKHFAASRDLKMLVISTQVHNVLVQQTWARHGFEPLAAFETVHLVDRAVLRDAQA
jgi:ribosomal protein S18 acetylase RimI-like enzyme